MFFIVSIDRTTFLLARDTLTSMSFQLRSARPFRAKKKKRKSYISSINIILVVPTILNFAFQALPHWQTIGNDSWKGREFS